MAETLEREWLRTWTAKYTSNKAQKFRKVEERGRDLIELIKYGSKILTEPDPNWKVKQKKITRRVYKAALYNILRAMQGLRLTDIYGFDLPKNKEKLFHLPRMNMMNFFTMMK